MRSVVRGSVLKWFHRKKQERLGRLDDHLRLLEASRDGVYSSFLVDADKTAEQFGVDARDIVVELGKRKVVGGQEDTIVEVAMMLAQQQKRNTIKLTWDIHFTSTQAYATAGGNDHG
jgi:DmpG-like communication domain